MLSKFVKKVVGQKKANELTAEDADRVHVALQAECEEMPVEDVPPPSEADAPAPF